MDALIFRKKKIILVPLVFISILVLFVLTSEFPDYDSKTILLLVLGIPVFSIGWIDFFRFKVLFRQ